MTEQEKHDAIHEAKSLAEFHLFEALRRVKALKALGFPIKQWADDLRRLVAEQTRAEKTAQRAVEEAVATAQTMAGVVEVLEWLEAHPEVDRVEFKL